MRKLRWAELRYDYDYGTGDFKSQIFSRIWTTEKKEEEEEIWSWSNKQMSVNFIFVSFFVFLAFYKIWFCLVFNLIIYLLYLKKWELISLLASKVNYRLTEIFCAHQDKSLFYWISDIRRELVRSLSRYKREFVRFVICEKLNDCISFLFSQMGTYESKRKTFEIVKSKKLKKQLDSKKQNINKSKNRAPKYCYW